MLIYIYSIKIKYILQFTFLFFSTFLKDISCYPDTYIKLILLKFNIQKHSLFISYLLFCFVLLLDNTQHCSWFCLGFVLRNCSGRLEYRVSGSNPIYSYASKHFTDCPFYFSNHLFSCIIYFIIRK